MIDIVKRIIDFLNRHQHIYTFDERQNEIVGASIDKKRIHWYLNTFLFGDNTTPASFYFSYSMNTSIDEKIYSNMSIFDWFDFLYLNTNIMFDYYSYIEETRNILHQIKGDSFEEIAIKMDLAGV